MSQLFESKGGFASSRQSADSNVSVIGASGRASGSHRHSKMSTTPITTVEMAFESVFWAPVNEDDNSDNSNHYGTYNQSNTNNHTNNRISNSNNSNKADRKPTVGVNRLAVVVAAHLDELEALKNMARRRRAALVASAKALDETATPSLQSQSRASSTLDDPLPSCIGPTTALYSSTLLLAAPAYRRHADSLTNDVIDPLSHFLVKHRRLLDFRKSQVDSHSTVHEKSVADFYAKMHRFFDAPSSLTKREYADAWTAAEHARASLQFHISEFLHYAQETEYARLVLCKHIFSVIETLEVSTLEQCLRLWTGPGISAANTNSPLLTLVDPSKGTDAIAFALQTGTARVPILKMEGLPISQSFGISLESLHALTQDPVPPFVRKCCAALHESLVTRKLKTPVDAWLSASPSTSAFIYTDSHGGGGSGSGGNGSGSSGALQSQTPAAQFLHMEANSTPASLGLHYSRVQREPPGIIAASLKQFLSDLPSAVVSLDVYDALALAYDAYESVDLEEQTEDEDIRVLTVRKLLRTMPRSHFETLRVIAALLFKTTQDLPDSSPKLSLLIHTLAPLLLRPKRETLETMQGKLGHKLVYDLIRNFPQIFGSYSVGINSNATESGEDDGVPPLDNDELAAKFFFAPRTPSPSDMPFDHDDVFANTPTTTTNNNNSDNYFFEQQFVDSFGTSPYYTSDTLPHRSVSRASTILSSKGGQLAMEAAAAGGSLALEAAAVGGSLAAEGWRGLVRLSGMASSAASSLGGENGSLVWSERDEVSAGSASGWFGGVSAASSAIAARFSLPSASAAGVASSTTATTPPINMRALELSSDDEDGNDNDSVFSGDAVVSTRHHQRNAQNLGVLSRVQCEWSGCGLEFEGNQSLMLHIAGVHMKQHNGEKVGEIGGGAGIGGGGGSGGGGGAVAIQNEGQ